MLSFLLSRCTTWFLRYEINCPLILGRRKHRAEHPVAADTVTQPPNTHHVGLGDEYIRKDPDGLLPIGALCEEVVDE